MITLCEYSRVGKINSTAPISVSSAAVSSYVIRAGSKGVSFENQGSKPYWYGGNNVDPANNIGNRIYPNSTLVYKEVREDFVIYFKCAATESTTIGVVGHE